MSYLSELDWGVIILYLVGITAFGAWCGKGQKNTRDYFLGSRTIPWWGVGLSIVATETSALTFIGVPAMAYGGNLAFIQIIIGYVIARIILAIYLVPRYFKGEIYSPYQVLSEAFGSNARLVAGGLFLVAGTLAAGVRVYVTCIPVQLMLGIEILPAIVLFVLLSLIYTYIGGIKAVVWTDAAQFVLLLAGGIFVLFYIPSLLDGGFDRVWREAGAAAKLKWFDAKFTLDTPFNIWMGLIGATVMVMSSHGADQLIVQRVLSCRSVADGRKSLMLSAVVILPLFLVFLLTGIVLWVYYQHHQLGIPIPEERPAGRASNDYIFPIFILTVLPGVVKGLLVVGVLSAAMSSVSSALSALASVSTMDFVKGMIKVPRGEEFYLRLSRRATVFWALAMILVAFLTKNVESVLKAAFSLSGLTSGAMLGGVLLALIWKRGRVLPVVTGMAVSFLVMLSINPIWNADHAWPWILWKVRIAWPWYALIGTAVTLGVAWAVRGVMGRDIER